MSSRIYLDGNATTRPCDEAIAAQTTALREAWGNPSSPHATGRRAAALLAEARGQVARWLGAAPQEVVFTAGGTEADRLGIRGALAAARSRHAGPLHVVSSSIEHAAIHGLLRQLDAEADDVHVTFVSPGADGRVDPNSLAAAMRADTALVCLMWANAETGVIQPVGDVAGVCREAGAALHVDAVQAAGKLPVDFGALGAHTLAVSAHKVHGPKGVGALLVRDGAPWSAPSPATHEQTRRAGTEATPSIAAFGAAAGAAERDGPDAWTQMAALRDRLERVLIGSLGGVHINGTAPRIPNTTSLRFDDIPSARLLGLLDRDGIDASNGSACSAGSAAPSRVLLAQGLTPDEALSSVRFSLTRDTTSADIDRAIAVSIHAVEELRARAAGRPG